jgi:hypothetical protein
MRSDDCSVATEDTSKLASCIGMSGLRLANPCDGVNQLLVRG